MERLGSGPEISVRWHPVSDDRCPKEALETYAFVSFRVHGECLTRHNNSLSATVDDEVLVSAYPLALWLASSWWRLRWEGGRSNGAPLDWRLSHELQSAGWGFVWPRIVFESDGDSIALRALPNPGGDCEPLQYFGAETVTMSASEFERMANDFVSKVLSRLAARGCEDTVLHAIWEGQTAVLRDKDLMALHRCEATLGFDFGEASQTVHDQLEKAIAIMGEEPLFEIAFAVDNVSPEGWVSAALNLGTTKGISGRYQMSLSGELPEKNSSTAYQYGWNLASLMRSLCGLDGKAVNNKDLGALIGMNEEDLVSASRPLAAIPIGLAVRTDNEQAEFHFRRSHPMGRRFEAARFVAEGLIADRMEAWLPITDSRSSRQKTQRAFAAEFLCPYEPLLDFLNSDYSDDRLQEAGEHFSVSPLVVQSQLANHGAISPSLVDRVV